MVAPSRNELGANAIAADSSTSLVVWSRSALVFTFFLYGSINS